MMPKYRNYWLYDSLTNTISSIYRMNSPQDILDDSREWGIKYGVLVEKFESEAERPRPVSVRVTVHLKNIPLKLWSRATATRILEDFQELIFLDDVFFDGPN
jgi:hypothetical protein